MGKFKEMLQYLRKRNNLSQNELAQKLGLAASTIGMYETGKREPNIETLEAIADYFNVDMNFLLGEPENIIKKIGGVPYTTSKRIPILGYISAGLPLYAEEHIEGYTYTDLNHGSEYFALRVKGDSMTAAQIFDNNILIVRKQSTVENGEIAVVIVDGENATVKRFYQKGDIVTLSPQSLNPQHLPQVYDLKQITIRIIGKVVRNQIDFE